MSWQDYISQQLLAKNLKDGAIAGKDGQIWAKVGPLLLVLPSLPRTSSSRLTST